MTNEKQKKIIWAGMFTALTTVATLIIQFPSPTGGYINAGDALVILSAFILGPVWGAAAAGFGSALADVLAGYMIYAPATLIIKALMALAAGAIISRTAIGKAAVFRAIAGSVTAEIIMIAGYFLFTATILRFGWGAAAEIPGNCVQGVFGAAAGTMLFFALKRIPAVKDNFLN